MCSTKRLLLTLGCWLATQGCYSPSVESPPLQGHGGTLEPGHGADGGSEIAGTGGVGVSGGGGASGGDGTLGGDASIPAGAGGVAGSAEGPSSPIPIFLDDALPDACVGQRFSHHLRAQGGGGNYYWQAQGLPAGLVLDAESGDLEGTLLEQSAGLHTFEVRLAGTTGRSKRDFQLLVRGSCRFAFLGRVTGTDRLFLGDVRQSAEAQSASELSLGLREGYAVSSFKVAPDGGKLAYLARAAMSGGADELQTVDLGDGVAPPAMSIVSGPPGANRIVEYAWSTDAQNLAVVTEDDAGTRVLAAYGADGLSASSPVGHLSDLFWVGDRVCFHAPPFQNAESIACLVLQAGGFGGAAEEYYPNPGYVFDNADYVSDDASFVGLMTDFPDDPARHVIYQAVPGLLAVYHGIATPSPDSSHVARVEGGGVSIFAMQEDETQPSAVIPNCLVVQAWSGDSRYLACQGGGEVALAAFDQQGRLAREETLSELSSSIGDFRRLFSPPALDGSVRWYVTDAADRRLRAVDLQQAEWTVRVIDVRPPTSASRVALAFRQGTSQLIYHHDDVLELIDLETDDRRTLNPVVMPFPLVCSEDFTTNRRETWCGGESPQQLFELSRDGNALLFQSEQGGLWSLDLTGSALPIMAGAANVICEEGVLGCRDQVQFER
ncbi:MAG: Ig domain-containing protein [Polyangiaceae bacterium]